MEATCEYLMVQGKYQCNVTALCVEIPNTEVQFHGVHLTGKTDEDVNWLKILHKTVKFFPKELDKKFKNLVWLQIAHCKLEKISKLDLAGLECLENVNFSGNNLTTLPDDLFVGTRELQTIYLQDNKLEYLSSKLFKPIEEKLLFIDLRKNAKIDDHYSYLHYVAGKNNLADFLKLIDQNCTPPERSDVHLEINEEKLKFDRLDNFSAHFEKIRISGKYSDATIKVYDKEYKVHKTVLAAQSPVFDEMFSEDSVEVAKFVTTIKNFNEKSFEMFLDYFYTGRLDFHADSVEIFKLASEFNVASLKTISIERILKNLSEENAMEIFNLGKQHKSNELAEKAFTILKKMYPDIVDALIENPGRLKEFVEAKQKIAAILKAASSEA